MLAAGRIGPTAAPVPVSATAASSLAMLALRRQKCKQRSDDSVYHGEQRRLPDRRCMTRWLTHWQGACVTYHAHLTTTTIHRTASPTTFRCRRRRRALVQMTLATTTVLRPAGRATMRRCKCPAATCTPAWPTSCSTLAALLRWPFER